MLWGHGYINTDNYDVSTGCENIKISFDIRGENSTCYYGDYNTDISERSYFKFYVRKSVDNGSSWTYVTSNTGIQYSSIYSSWNNESFTIDVSETSQIMLQIKAYTRRIGTGYSQDDYNEWYIDNIKIESSLGGNWTNGNNILDESSLWYDNNGVTTSKNGKNVEISGSLKLTAGSPSVGKFLTTGTASWASVPVIPYQLLRQQLLVELK